MREYREPERLFPTEPERIASVETKSSPSALAWLPLLYFKPGRFFPHFISRHHPAVTILLVLVWGAVSTLGRIDRQYQRGLVPDDLLDSWAYMLGFALGGGIISGAIYYLVGGWWYRRRVRWSGVSDPDPYAVRRVYVYSKAVYVLPVMCVYITLPFRYSTPLDFIVTGSWFLGFAAVFFLGWSILVSYIGVRRSFMVRTLPATIWFLVLPGLFPIFGLVALSYLWRSTAPIPPNVTNTQSAVHYGVPYELPGNWSVDRLSSKPWEGGGYTRIDARQDAIVEILTYPSDRSAAEEIDDSVIEIRNYWEQVQAPEPQRILEDGWTSTSFEAKDRQTAWYTVTIYVHTLPDGKTVELRSTCLTKEYEMFEPGLETVRLSIQTR